MKTTRNRLLPIAITSLSALFLGACTTDSDSGQQSNNATDTSTDTRQTTRGGDTWAVPHRHQLNARLHAETELQSGDNGHGGVIADYRLAENKGLFWLALGRSSADGSVVQELAQEPRQVPTLHGGSVDPPELVVRRTFSSRVGNGLRGDSADVLEIQIANNNFAPANGKVLAAFNEKYPGEEGLALIDELMLTEQTIDDSVLSIRFQKEGLDSWADAYPMTLAVDAGFRAIRDRLVGLGFASGGGPVEIAIRRTTEHGRGSSSERRLTLTIECGVGECVAVVTAEEKLCDIPGAISFPCGEFEPVDTPEVDDVALYYEWGSVSLCGDTCERFADPEAAALKAANTASVELLRTVFCSGEECNRAQAIVDERETNGPFLTVGEVKSRVRDNQDVSLFGGFEDAFLHTAALERWPYSIE